MTQDLDISNIESKPSVVLVSNQAEFNQLMQHLDKDAKVWKSGHKPTQWYPRPSVVSFPFGIKTKADNPIRWRSIEQIQEDGENTISFPEYAAKHIKPKSPKRDRIRIERKKHDELVAERDRLKADNKQLKKDYDLSTNHVHEMTALYAKYEQMSNRLRDQRDMARFIAALLLIVSVGFAIAVWIGKLIPVV